MTVGEIINLFKAEKEETGRRNQSDRRNQQSTELESISDLFSDFRLSHDLVLMWTTDVKDGSMLEVTTNSINTRGTIKLTPNWNLSVGNIGYDFRTKRITYPYLAFTRNLHCWEMGFNWAPQRGSYSFFLRVKQAPLNFIKIPYEKNNQDVFF